MPNLAHILRQVMNQHDNASLHELLVHMPPGTTGAQVSNLLATDISARRASRRGQRGSYRYSLTHIGQLAAQDPNFVRSRFARRQRGRPRPTPPEAA